MSHVHMDEVAGVYDHTIPSHVQAHYLRKRAAFIQRRMTRGVMLDVGCGTGQLDEVLRETWQRNGIDVIGIDESIGMLQESQRARGLACLCGDSAQMPIASNSVDAAITIATLHHVVSREAVRATLAEMLRVVKPGGWVLIWDHNPLNPYWPLFMKRLPQDQEPTRLVPLRELVADLKALGVSRIEAHRLGLVPDFAPPALLWIFQTIEWVVERFPGVRAICAHNVVVATKPTSSMSER